MAMLTSRKRQVSTNRIGVSGYGESMRKTRKPHEPRKKTRVAMTLLIQLIRAHSASSTTTMRRKGLNEVNPGRETRS